MQKELKDDNYRERLFGADHRINVWHRIRSWHFSKCR
jgi:hypothetical protein